MRAMKRTKRTGRALALLLALLLCLGSALPAGAPRAAAAEALPSLRVEYCNLSCADEICQMYAVSYENLDPQQQEVRMLFWDEPRPAGDYTLGTESASVLPTRQETIGGKDCLVFYSAGFAPKQLTDPLYCRACVSVNGTVCYSEPFKYLPVKYIQDVLATGSDEDRAVYSGLRAYGAAAQLRLDYHTERLASATYHTVKLEGMTLEDGFSYGFYQDGALLELEAQIPQNGSFLRWEDENGEILGTEPVFSCHVTEDMTIRLLSEGFSWSGLSGKRFDAQSRDLSPYFFLAEPFTVEAAFQIPPTLSGRGGVILGNYGYGKHAMSLELAQNGKLRLYCAESGSSDLYFDTDLRSTELRHIALTVPQKGEDCRLYVDGSLVETKPMPCDIPAVNDTMMVGGDYRSGNAQYFKGTLYGVAVYRGQLSDEEIALDAQYGADPNRAGIGFSYLFDGQNELRDRGPLHKDLCAERSGLHLESASDRYTLTNTFSAAPRTYEALFDTAADVSNNKGCTIVGNYNDVYVPGVSFRVYLNGRPSLCLRYSKTHQDQFTFPKSILGEGRVHVAITADDSYIYGYLNGKQVLKKEYTGEFPELTAYPFSVGGDNRPDNTWWFRDGSIYSVHLFSEYRSAEQIAEDINRVDPNDPSLMLAYDFEQSDRDQGPEQNDLRPYFYDGSFVDPAEYDYTFACVGDTQSLVKYNPDKLHYLYDFLLEHAEDMKIDRVIGLGDMTEDNTADQWELVSQEVFRLDGKLPYTVIRGNHDHKARTPEAEATKELMFGMYFDNETYRKQFDGSYDGSPANVYKRFSVCGVPYLMICLDYGPEDAVLDWAGSLADQYPNDNVILVTHAFLFHDATTIDAGDLWPPTNDGGVNNCDAMWDKLVSKHKNIVLVLCGHDQSNEIVVSKMTGDHGNTVTSILIDPQDTDRFDRPAGLVALLHFKDGGRSVMIENYSTVQGKFYRHTNQFTVEDLDLVSAP